MDPVTLGLCSQIDLDFEVEKAAKTSPHREPVAGGRDAASGLADDHRRRARCRRGQPPSQNPSEAEREAEREADAVFAKLKSMKGPDEDDRGRLSHGARVTRAR